MRKAIYSIFIAVMIFATVFSSSVKNEAFADVSDNAVIVMKGEITDSVFSVKTNLVKNDGIFAMAMELEYDDAALTLIGVEQGNALSSLNLITSNTETEKGFSIRPFNFNYSGDKNDYSTGNLFTLTFKVNENAPNGTYKINLIYEHDKGVNYVENGELKTRNLSVDAVEVKIKKSKPAEIYTVSETQNGSSENVPVMIAMIVAAAALVIALVILITRKRKRWKKI